MAMVHLEHSRFAKSSASVRRRDAIFENYSHVYRVKRFGEFIKLTVSSFGAELISSMSKGFAYSILLHLIASSSKDYAKSRSWILIGFAGSSFLPVFGILSDKSPLVCGRRRPFMVLMAICLLFGFLLVVYGKFIRPNIDLNEIWLNASLDDVWNVATIFGAIVADQAAVSYISFSKIYFLDVTIEDDHLPGLSLITLMSSLGGITGYGLCSIKSKDFLVGYNLLVLLIVPAVFIFTAICTLRSQEEVPLKLLNYGTTFPEDYENDFPEFRRLRMKQHRSYDKEMEKISTYHIEVMKQSAMMVPKHASIRNYLHSVFFMPLSFWILFFTCFASWLVFFQHWQHTRSYVLFVNTTYNHTNNDSDIYEGIGRMSCEGMAILYAASALHAVLIGYIIRKIGTKWTMICGLCVHLFGIVCLALLKDQILMFFAFTSGVLYSTLKTIPFLLMAQHHSRKTFELNKDGSGKIAKNFRGLGTDVTALSSVELFAQFSMFQLAEGMHCFHAEGVSTILTLCTIIGATQVTYLCT